MFHASKQPEKTGISTVELLDNGRFAVMVDGLIKFVAYSAEECAARAALLAPKASVTDSRALARVLG